MTTILVDHDIEGYGMTLWGALGAEGWIELLSLKLATFETVGLPFNSSDRQVWRFAQINGMILLTNNRNMKGEDSLEQTLREENRPDSLPVLTISSVDQLKEKNYRERCATRLAEIVLDLENHLGTRRIFIP
jgi:hypothetical protein